MSGRRAKKDRFEAEAREFLSVTPWGKASKAWNSAESAQNARIQMYERLIEILAISRFTWTGLPDSIDERFVELTLFERGSLIFFLDKKEKRFMATYQNYSAGNMNAYLNPTRFRPLANNYVYHELSSKEAVPIWDNQLRTTLLDVMFIYAQRLANIDRALDVNLDNLTTPMIISCSEEQKLSLQNAIRQKSQGVPVIFSYDSINLADTLGVFPNTTPNITNELMQLKAQVWNEMVKFLGIENSNNEKKERLITDEIQAGSETTNVFRLGFLKARQQACDQINRMFEPLNVGIDWANRTSGGIMTVKDGDQDGAV